MEKNTETSIICKEDRFTEELSSSSDTF